ncbi:tetratricopeptide repeat protein 23-like [Mytilus trossulus]
MHSEDSDDDMNVGAPMMVEVKGHSRTPRQHSQRSLHRDSDEDEENRYEDDYEDDMTTARSGRTTSRKKKPGKNGRHGIDMTPPDKLLKQAVKRIGKFRENEKHDEAIRELVRCIALTRIVYGANHWKLAESHADLAEAYLDLKGLAPQADYHAESAKTIMLNTVATYTTEQEKADVIFILFKIHHTQGRALTEMKQYSDAEKALSKADRTCHDFSRLTCVSDNECDEMEIKYCHATARLYWKQKKHARSAAQFDKLLDLMKRQYGPDSMDLVPIYQEYGKISFYLLELSKGKYANYDKATDLYLQSHTIAGANYREGSTKMVDTGLALAQAYISTGKEEAEDLAEKYLNECLVTCQTGYGPQHKKTIEVQDELARLLIRTDRQEDGLDILKSTLPDKCEIYGDYSEQVSDTHKLTASVHLSQGNLEKSLRGYKKCLNIEQIVLGKNHRKTKDTERTIDILMASPGLSNKFVLSKEDELKKRPKFNTMVTTKQTLGGFKSSAF